MKPVSPVGFLAPDAFAVQNHLCVVPVGGMSPETRLYWEPQQLQYYANYMLEGKPVDRMFGGIIFNGISVRESHVMHPLYVGFAQASDHTDWLLWLDVLFAPGANLHALHAAAAGRQMDVWVSIPYPHPTQALFGPVQGVTYDFQNEGDRLKAAQWWIDQLLQRWSAHPMLHDRLTLRGLLWQKESLDAGDEPLIEQLNAYIRSRKLLSLLLPNYGAAGVLDWEKRGFDLAALNPNYYGKTGFDYNWVTHASSFSKVFHLGMQINFGKGIIYSDTHHLDYFNLGLPDRNNYMTQSFLVYQLSNQALDDICRNRFVDYIRLYSFIKGIYSKVDYPGIEY